MTHHCTLTILKILLCRKFWRLIHRELCQQKGCQSTILCFFFSQQTAALWPFLQQFLHSPLKRLPLILSFFRQSAALWPYLPHLLHVSMKKLVLVLLLSPALNSNTFSYVSFSGFFFPPSSVFQNQRIFLEIFVGHLVNVDIIGHTDRIYSSGNVSNTCALISSPYLSRYSWSPS